MTPVHALPEPVVLAAGHWPQGDDDRAAGPPSLAGFVGSSFSPLVAVAADRCLRTRYGEPPLPRANRTAIVLVSASGDRASARHVHEVVAEGKRLGPLYFFQSVPNSVAGHVAARWGLNGPVVCLSPAGEPRAEGLSQAALVIADGDADQVLVVLVEQQPGAEHAAALLVSGGDPS